MARAREGSAVENFFETFVTNLADHHRDDDPSLDLNLMSSEPRRAIEDGFSNEGATKNTNQKRDLRIDELYLIKSQLEGEGPYKDKLILIMLKGLEATLSANYYRFFLDSGPPPNWIPIVKMNDSNAPYVEFLIKADISDEHPCTQLSEYTPEHMYICQYILDKLYKSASRSRTAVISGSHERQQGNRVPNQPKPKALCNGQSRSSQASTSGQAKTASMAPAKNCAHQKTISTKPTKVTTEKENQRKSAPMLTSTPIKRRQVSSSNAPAAAHKAEAIRTSRHDHSSTFTESSSSLNDSKRVPPPRACKSGPSSYMRYF